VNLFCSSFLLGKEKKNLTSSFCNSIGHFIFFATRNKAKEIGSFQLLNHLSGNLYIASETTIVRMIMKRLFLILIICYSFFQLSCKKGGTDSPAPPPPPNVPVTGIDINISTINISIGGTQQLTVTVVPANASNPSVSWSSSNTAVATVNTDGLVTALSAGTATITARSVANTSISVSRVVNVLQSYDKNVAGYGSCKLSPGKRANEWKK